MDGFITKEEVIARLRRVKEMGWVPGVRGLSPKNDGDVGNTLEKLLEIEENNLPIANTGEWELKAKRRRSTSPITLFHKEPLPRRRVVPRVLLPNFGWEHDNAGTKYPADEKSFRQTLSATQHTDRGFRVEVDDEKSVRIVFSLKEVSVEKHGRWREGVIEKTSGILSPEPYWDTATLSEVLHRKMKNCIFVVADTRKEQGRNMFRYAEIHVLSHISVSRFLAATRAGNVLIDFDARTRHNHGTKFRARDMDTLAGLYESAKLL